VLKDMLKGAAISAIQAGDNPFADKFHRLLVTKTAPELARLTVARSIANTLWAMWRKDEGYQPHRPTQWEQHNSAETTATTTAAMRD
jgi:hypothetical protein